MYDLTKFSLLKVVSYSSRAEKILHQLYRFTPRKPPSKTTLKLVRSERYLSANIIKDVLRYEAANNADHLIVALRSPLGTGKTSLIRRALIEREFCFGPIVVITNRVCLVEAIAASLDLDFYQDFRPNSNGDTKYKDEDGKPITMQSYIRPTEGKNGIVITTDSVHQLESLNITNFTVIIDEAVSVSNTIMMSDTDVATHRIQSYTKIRNMISKAKRTFLLDAHLDDVTIDFFGGDDRNTIAIVNKYIRAYEQPVDIFYRDAEVTFFLRIEEEIMFHKGKVWIACDCKHTTETLYSKYVRYPDLKVLCINSSNSKSEEVQQMLKTPELFYDYDVVITSPSTDVGLSVDPSDDSKKRFTMVAMIVEYGYYSPFKVEQAMNRVRDLSAKRIIFQKGNFFNTDRGRFAPYLKVDFYALLSYIRDNSNKQLYPAHFVDHLYKHCAEMHVTVSGSPMGQSLVYRALLKYIIAFTGNTYVEHYVPDESGDMIDDYTSLKDAKLLKSAEMFAEFMAEILDVNRSEMAMLQWNYFFPIDLYAKNPDKAAKLRPGPDKRALEKYRQLPEANQLVARIHHYYGHVGISDDLVQNFETMIASHEMLRMYMTRDFEYLSTSHTDTYVPGHQKQNIRKWIMAYDVICYLAYSRFNLFVTEEMLATEVRRSQSEILFSVDLTNQCYDHRYSTSLGHIAEDVFVKNRVTASHGEGFNAELMEKLTSQNFGIEDPLDKLYFIYFLGTYYLSQINPDSLEDVETLGKQFMNSAIMLDKLSYLQMVGEIQARRTKDLVTMKTAYGLPPIVEQMHRQDPEILPEYNVSKRTFRLNVVKLLDAIDFHSENIGAKESLIKRPFYWSHKHPLYYQKF